MHISTSHNLLYKWSESPKWRDRFYRKHIPHTNTKANQVCGTTYNLEIEGFWQSHRKCEGKQCVRFQGKGVRTLLGLLYPEDKGITFTQNFRNPVPVDTVQYLKIL
jgi:hypothetical protein